MPAAAEWPRQWSPPTAPRRHMEVWGRSASESGPISESFQCEFESSDLPAPPALPSTQWQAVGLGMTQQK